jgi:hypothetical protein
MGTFEAGAWPGACWRPYGDSSPFNRKIGSSPAIVSGSRAASNRMAAAGGLDPIGAGDPERDYGIATYFATETDPTYKVECLEEWGHCALEDVRVPLPAGAAPSGRWPLPEETSWDSHLTVVDQKSGWEYDMWNVWRVDHGQREIEASWGGRTKIAGDGLGSAAIAANYGSFAGVIRPQELAAGRIDHALVMNVPCTKGKVWPATGTGRLCADAGLPSRGAPYMGSRYQLAISAEKLSTYPSWQRAILRALKQYGAYVADTTGLEEDWSLKFESRAGYTSLGHEDPFVTLGRELGFDPQDYNENGWDEYWFLYNKGVNWERMRLVK